MGWGGCSRLQPTLFHFQINNSGCNLDISFKWFETIYTVIQLSGGSPNNIYISYSTSVFHNMSHLMEKFDMDFM
jgi:hypothetical protein